MMYLIPCVRAPSIYEISWYAKKTQGERWSRRTGSRERVKKVTSFIVGSVYGGGSGVGGGGDLLGYSVYFYYAIKNHLPIDR